MIKARAYLSLFSVLAILGMASRAPALEMSSKRDCAICHVMWMDDFRTAKETLIKWQPGNVLMKDTQGVVSAEDVCYSCHDGYVVDSRHIANKYNQHKTFVKPSKSVTVPATLPLSNKDEVYCGTCHTAHGPGAPPAGNLPTPASFFRVRNVDSRLCEMCHQNETAFKRTNGHPLGTTTLELPDRLFELGSIKAREPNQIICQTCHKVHGARGAKIDIVANQNSALCTICHAQQQSVIDTQHDLRVSLPGEKNIKAQRPSESGPCGACHTPHNAAGKKLWAKRLGPGTPAAQMCLACHAEAAGLKIKGVGRYSHPVGRDLSPQASVPDGLPLFLGDATRNPAGKIQCFTCHDAHRWDPNSAASKGLKNVAGDASNSFLRMANDSSSSLCLACHKDQKPVVTTDHNLNITAPVAKNLQQFSVRDSGPCGACHIPHNAAGQKLWARKLKPGNFASQTCLSCHDPNVGFQTKSIGKHTHPLSVAPRSKTAVPNKLPLFLESGVRNPAGKVQCFTCHDAHRW
ncbi:MAG: cytochrome c3 family protein, partial [Desulfobacterales bacterium]